MSRNEPEDRDKKMQYAEKSRDSAVDIHDITAYNKIT